MVTFDVFKPVPLNNFLCWCISIHICLLFNVPLWKWYRKMRTQVHKKETGSAQMKLRYLAESFSRQKGQSPSLNTLCVFESSTFITVAIHLIFYNALLAYLNLSKSWLIDVIKCQEAISTCNKIFPFKTFSCIKNHIIIEFF